MKNIKSTLIYKRLKLMIIAIIGFGFPSIAQEGKDLDSIDIFLDDMLFEEVYNDNFIDDLLQLNKKISFLSIGFNYDSNTYFAGRESDIDMFNLSPQISYFHESGFNVSLSGIWYQDYDPNWTFTNLSLGYFNYLNKSRTLNYSIGYSRLMYSDGDDTYNNSLDLSIGFNTPNRLFGTDISASYLFGTESTYQLSWTIFSRITLLQNRNLALRFMPSLSLAVAKQYFEFYDYDTSGNIINTTSTEVFDLLNTKLSLPIYLSTKNWYIEAGYNINFPNPIDLEGDLPNTSYFNLRLIYSLEL